MKPMNPVARPALRHPAEADLADLQRDWSGAISPDPCESFEMSFRDIVFPHDADGQSTVAELDNAVVGFCSVIKGNLRALYVAEGYRNRGVGAQLLAHGIEFARSMDWTIVAARTPCHWTGSVHGVNIRNRAAISLLRHHGFKRGSKTSHMEIFFSDDKGAPPLAPLPSTWSISEYSPIDLDDMREFVRGLGLRKWVWTNWEAMYSVMECGRIRLIGRHNDRIVGCVDVLISRSGEAGINFISVAHADRHKGTGSHLLRTVCRVAQERGARSMIACNVIAQPFYLKNGWRVQSDYRRMSLRLSAKG